MFHYSPRSGTEIAQDYMTVSLSTLLLYRHAVVNISVIDQRHKVKASLKKKLSKKNTTIIIKQVTVSFNFTMWVPTCFKNRFETYFTYNNCIFF